MGRRVPNRVRLGNDRFSTIRADPHPVLKGPTSVRTGHSGGGALRPVWVESRRSRPESISASLHTRRRSRFGQKQPVKALSPNVCFMLKAVIIRRRSGLTGRLGLYHRLAQNEKAQYLSV